MIQGVIYDLDDTLYPTSTLSREPFSAFFNHLQHWTKAYLNVSQFHDMVASLWSRPLDEVLAEYPLPMDKVAQSLELLEQIDIRPADLTPIAGVHLIPEICTCNILVTSGIPSLQWAKIEALGVKDYFKEVIIDNPLLPNAGKEPYFEHLLNRHQWEPYQVLVVGDNPRSELMAGHNLGMHLIQMAKSGTEKSPLVHGYVRDLHDLKRWHDEVAPNLQRGK